MNNSTARCTLWGRIHALMIERWGSENQNRLAREACVGVATIARMKASDTSIGLDVLDKVARALGVEAWQLICPEDQFQHGIQNLSPMALDLAQTLDRLPDPEKRRKAYALVHQVLLFGLPNTEAPAPSAPAPSTKPTREHHSH